MRYELAVLVLILVTVAAMLSIVSGIDALANEMAERAMEGLNR